MKENDEESLFAVGRAPGCSSRNNVITYLEQHREAFPERPALRWVRPDSLATWTPESKSSLAYDCVTYGDFARIIDNVAHGLAGRGLGKGDCVIIFLPMGVGMYAAMFAVQKIGAIAVFLDSWARRNHLGASAACVQPRAMISHRAAFDLIDGLPEFAVLEHRIIAGPGADASFSARLEEMMQQPGEAGICPVEADDTALVTFTTGSSGTPKGANRTHRFLCAQHEALESLLPYDATDSDMPAFPVFSLNNLACGVTTMLPALDLAQPRASDAALLAWQIRQEAVSCATLSPSMLTGLTRYCLEDGCGLPSLRRVVTGGAPISRDNVADFKRIAPDADLWILYGSTEVEPMAHIEAGELLAQPVEEDTERVEQGVNVGHVSEALEYKFIRLERGSVDVRGRDWSEFEAAPSEVGEFIVAGEHVCRDYYNNEEAFARAKIVDDAGRIWHRTGDLAKLDANGHLRVVGRLHNAISRAGSYCFPVQAEILLKRLPSVRQAAYVGLPDDALGERAVVAVASDAVEDDRTSVCREIARLFAKNDIPLDALYFLDEIPLDPRHHSKVEYDLLRESLLRETPRDWLTA